MGVTRLDGRMRFAALATIGVMVAALAGLGLGWFGPSSDEMVRECPEMIDHMEADRPAPSALRDSPALSFSAFVEMSRAGAPSAIADVYDSLVPLEGEIDDVGVLHLWDTEHYRGSVLIEEHLDGFVVAEASICLFVDEVG